MTDREMLELAARAAGIVVTDDMRELWLHVGSSAWNPLTDDGDALRLAVKLELILCIRREGVTDATMRAPRTGMTPYLSFLEQHKDDPYAATRRAIVRAAAEIGRQMEVTK
jgi:hypothetical protein